MEFIDAIREGDDDRIIRCWRFFLPLFKSTQRKNYAVESFILLAQLDFLFSPRMAAQLKWNCTVNIHGKIGRNIPCDLHMEHLNRLCKGCITGLGANISDKAVVRIGKCLGEMAKVISCYDSANGIPEESEKHARKSEKNDCEKILQHLNEMEVFSSIPGRKHIAFGTFRANPARNLTTKKLKKWMNKQMKKLLL